MSQEFQPMVSQLSKKAALPLAKILATCRNNVSNTGPWRQIGTRPSATVMLTWLWQCNVTQFILHNIHIALQLLHRLFGKSREFDKPADFLVVGGWRSMMKMFCQRPTSEWQPHLYLTMSKSPDGRYWYHSPGTLSFKLLALVRKWTLLTPDIVICRPVWLDKYGRVASWLAQ